MVRSEELLEVFPDREIYTGKGGQNAQVLLPMAYSYKCGYMDDILSVSYTHLDVYKRQPDWSFRCYRL